MKHKGSEETYEFIAKWITPDFFFSKNDLWDRMGMLGVFGDYVLSCTKGDILEIGCGESSIYLSALAKKYNRRIYHCDVGGGKIDNPLTISGYMDAPNSIYFKCTSDEMFKQGSIAPITLGFIDGDHSYEQVKKDFENLLPLIVENGYIFLHDTYPPSEDWLHENACGTVYKFRQELDKLDNIETLTLTRGTAMGVGLTVCRKKPNNLEYYQR